MEAASRVPFEALNDNGPEKPSTPAPVDRQELLPMEPLPLEPLMMDEGPDAAIAPIILGTATEPVKRSALPAEPVTTAPAVIPAPAVASATAVAASYVAATAAGSGASADTVAADMAPDALELFLSEAAENVKAALAEEPVRPVAPPVATKPSAKPAKRAPAPITVSTLPEIGAPTAPEAAVTKPAVSRARTPAKTSEPASPPALAIAPVPAITPVPAIAAAPVAAPAAANVTAPPISLAVATPAPAIIPTPPITLAVATPAPAIVPTPAITLAPAIVTVPVIAPVVTPASAPATASVTAPAAAPAAVVTPAMDRDFIARNQIVERYISGRLPIKGATDFERFCHDNPSMLDELGLPERVNAGLRLLEASGKPEPWQEEPRKFWEKPQLLIGLAVGVLALAVALVVVSNGSSEKTRRIDALTKVVAEQPLEAATKTSTIRLLPSFQGSTNTPAVTLGGSGGAQLADLKIDMSRSAYRGFKVTIDRVDQGRVAILHNLLKDSNGHVRMALNTSALGPGTYQFTIEGLTWRGDPVPEAWLTIAVAH